MSDKQRNKRIPALRFPEFEDSGEWKKMAIEKVCEKPFSGGTPSSTNEKYYGGNIPFIRSAEINKEATELYITELGLKNSSAKMVKKGDVLVAMYGANSGDVAICKINGAINQAILCLRSKSNNEFLSQYLAYKKEWIRAKYLQGGQGNLSSDIIKTIELLFPSPQEQQKIASFLSNLDELIDAHKQKLELLKRHKKGLMQKLFPQEGEKVPKLRFPEFKDRGEWVENSISQLGEPINGLSGKKGDDFGSGSPYVQYKQVFDKNYIDFSQCGKVNIDKNEKQNKLQKGDILFTTSSETPNEVGFASVIITQPKVPTYLNSFCFILRPNSLDNLKPNFSRYLFHSKIKRKKINAIAQGAIRYNLSKKSFLQIKLPVPTPQEQQKIASCLSSLDELITGEEKKIEQLEKHKKGLMQGLFPEIN